MFGIRRKKKKINGAPPGHFPNELHEFTFNTQKMRMGMEEQSSQIKKKRNTREKDNENKKEKKKKN